MTRNFNASVLMHMKLLFLFMVCFILWLFTNSAKKIHLHGIDVILKNGNLSVEEYQLCQKAWKENNMTTMKEFLT
jgi:hypothetical protein